MELGDFFLLTKIPLNLPLSKGDLRRNYYCPVMFSRRQLFQRILASFFMLSLSGCTGKEALPRRKTFTQKKVTLYRSVHGAPSDNISKVMEMMGGMEKIFGAGDIIVIKPNIQWWNQGAPNIACVNAFISMIMERSGGFRGEVVIAENNHRGAQPWNEAGWTQSFERNSDSPGIRNYNQLADHLKKNYGDRFSVCHWIDIDAGGKRVYSPADGPGYVICDGTGGVPLLSISNGLKDEKRREVIMSYPIFQTDKGTIIDLKNGIWSKGSYTRQPLKFVNFAALNHHSFYCGPTSAMKNFLGVCDLSGGPDPHNNGKLTNGYYNFHSFPFDKWSKGPVQGMLGLEIGMFLHTIRKPDLNITTAEWVGISTRTEPPVVRTRAVCTCTDPIALDYHTAKYILYPNSHIRVHDSDFTGGPFYHDLQKCSEQSGCILDEQYVDIQSFDHSTARLQKDDELVVIGEKIWGNDIKSLFKYCVTRLTS